MKILSVDPGSTQSGFVLYDTATREVLDAGVYMNDDMLDRLHTLDPDKATLVLERPTSSGASMLALAKLKNKDYEGCAQQIASGFKSSGELVTTAIWYGCFSAAAGYTPDTVPNVTRQDVKRVFRVGPGNGSTDSRIRAAILSGYPAGAEKRGGALAKCKTHAWAAMACAIAWEQINKTAHGGR